MLKNDREITNIRFKLTWLCQTAVASDYAYGDTTFRAKLTKDLEAMEMIDRINTHYILVFNSALAVVLGILSIAISLFSPK